MWRQKLQTPIDFPLEGLDLKNYRYVNQSDPGPTSYDLYGVVNHYGTMEGGHYISNCKHAIHEDWYKYEDHEVTKMNFSDVRSSQAAYILFYVATRN